MRECAHEADDFIAIRFSFYAEGSAEGDGEDPPFLHISKYWPVSGETRRIDLHYLL